MNPRLLGAVAVSLWLAVVAGRALQIVHWPWLWVFAPYWIVVAGLMVFTVGCLAFSTVLRAYLWLSAWTERRRRERVRREFVRALGADFFKGREGTAGRERQ